MQLEICNLTKDFKDKKVINGISLTMERGVYGLLGINGVGKTTLIRMICSLIRQSSGEIKYNGENILDLDTRYRQILGYLPQDFGFYPNLSIYDYMMYISTIKGISNKVAKHRIIDLLHKVSLENEKNRKMGTLSGGMQRRVGIAQALLNNPKILILDEPTAGLDPNERIRFRNLISELSRDRIVILSTHIVSDIEFIADEILLMKDGAIFKRGSSEEIINSIDKKVWTVRVLKDEYEKYLEEYLIANMKKVDNGIELRIVSKNKPSENAVRVDANLEDAFLSYFGEKTGE